MLLPLRHYHNFVTAPWCILVTDLLRRWRSGETAQILHGIRQILQPWYSYGEKFNAMPSEIGLLQPIGRHRNKSNIEKPFFMTRFTFLFPFLFSFFALSAQDGPCMKILQNGEDNTAVCPAAGKYAPASAAQLLLEMRHPDKTASVTGNGWLKAFWIFGDGNFAAFPDNGQKYEESTLDMNYTFAKEGSYIVTPLMIEKKTNREPPGRATRKVTVKGSPGTATERPDASRPAPQQSGGATFRTELRGADRAALLPSSQVRLGGYETAVAVSCPMPGQFTQSVALFFYNSVATIDGAPFSSGTLFKTGNVEILPPAYLNRAPSFIPVSQLPLYIEGGRGRNTFGHVAVQNIQVDTSLVPPNFTEFRFFPLLKTPKADSLGFNTGIPEIDQRGMGKVQFVALILQNLGVEQNGNEVNFFTGQGVVDSLTGPQRERLLSLISLHLPWLTDLVNPTTLELRSPTGENTGVYVRGVAQTQTEIVSVIDPTQLVVHRICPDSAHAGQYVADMTLTVCNEGNLTESKIIVDLLKQPGTSFTNLQFDPNQISAQLSPTDPASIWKFEYGKNGGLAGAYESGQYVSSCFDVHFKATTDWAGVQALQQGTGLTARVHFTTAIVNAVQEYANIPLDSSAVTAENGYNCGDPTPPKGDHCWWIVLLFVLLLLLWWFRKQRQEEA